MSNQAYRLGLRYVLLILVCVFADDTLAALRAPDAPPSPLRISTPVAPRIDYDVVIALAQSRARWVDAGLTCVYIAVPAPWGLHGWPVQKADLGLPTTAPCP